MPVRERLTILHLSDLHFGWDEDPYGHAERRLVLDGLLRALESLDSDWKPECVCVTGDLGWKGRATDYQEAGDWLRRLLGVLGIGPEALVICPGNHDVNRELAAECARPSDWRVADWILRKIPPPQHYQNPFGEFVAFCHSFGLPPLKAAEWENWLIGSREYRGVNFVSLNSSWFSRDDLDRRGLWLGQPQLKILEDRGQLASPARLSDPDCPVTVVIFHHPEEWLHESECQRSDHRQNTIDHVALRCHALLTGHTHAEPRRADRKAECAWHFRGGAAYRGAAHPNSFRIIRFEPDHLVYKCFEYSRGAPDYLWKDAFEAQCLWYRVQDESSRRAAKVAEDWLAALRDKAAADARRLIESKSRAIKPYGPLPATVPLNVSVHDRAVPLRLGADTTLPREPKQYAEMPLYQAARQSRNTLLLGDLGAGKSTLAGMLAVETQERDPRSLAFVAPARGLAWPDPPTARALVEALSRYFSDQICPGEDTPGLEQLLRENVELTVVVDGLDEVAPQRASELLNHLSSLSTHWPNIQVLAAARPVELMGVNYADWQVLTTAPLGEAGKVELLRAEAVAEGVPEADALERARQLARSLKSQPLLDQVADSPLAMRLLYPRLSRTTERWSLTLGDLLFDLLKERLEAWPARDGKSSAFETFESHYPDFQSRMHLMGELALELVRRGRMTEDQAISYIRDRLGQASSVQAGTISKEAIQFFQLSGILSGGEELQFALQPFLEFASGHGIAAGWRSPGTDGVAWLGRDHWRSVSFAATVIRRFGWTEYLRDSLEGYLASLLSGPDAIPAASYIVYELQDQQFAEEFVALLGGLGLRPLTYARDERGPSSEATAEALCLAGRSGFDWLFKQYLDPRYPIINTGSGVIHEVFEHWVRGAVDALTEYEREKLRLLVLPHVEAGSMLLITFVPLLAIIIPDAFGLKERLWFSSAYLGDDQFSARVESDFRSAHSNGNKDLANGVLVARVREGYERAAWAADLWLRLNLEVPPLEIIRGVLRAIGNRGYFTATRACVGEFVKRLGEDAWERLLRWHLFDKDLRLAAGAAFELHSRGEKRLPLLGEPTLAALHDGGYVREAEEILDDLISSGGARAVCWLADRVSAADSDDMGAQSAWWRVLLGHLSVVGNRGPEILAKASRGVGCLLLARHPEVRQRVRSILGGEHGSGYVQALRARLDHLDPVARHGAAMLLVACHTPADTDALKAVARLRSSRPLTSWWEWEQFCLTLSFGASNLAAIRSRLPDLDALAQTFVLALLNRNGVALGENEFARLVTGLQELHNWSLDRVDAPVLASSRALPILKQLVEHPTGGHAERAAESLLKYHEKALSEEEYARCVSLTVRGDPFRLQGLQDAARRLQADPAFAEAVRQAADHAVASGRERPLLDLVRAALADSGQWRGVVWLMLCDTSRVSHDFDDCGQWLLDYGRSTRQHREAIGAAAKQLLEDPRVQQSRWSEPRQWMTLLADEFVGLPKPEIERALIGPASIHGAVDSALVARLGYLPDGHRKRQSVGSVPVLPSTEAREHLAAGEKRDRLKDVTKASDTTHPDLCPLLEELALEAPLSAEELNAIAAEGTHGALAASALSFIYGWAPNSDLVMRLSGSLYWLPPDDTCLARLARIFHSAHYVLVAEEGDARDCYIRVLGKAVETAGDVEVLSAAAELLSLTGELKPSQAEHVLDRYAAVPRHYHDRGVGELLARWLSGQLDAATFSAVTGSVKRGLHILDGEPWDLDAAWPSGAFPFLLLPLAHWKLTDAVDEVSLRVFQRGIRFLFTGAQTHRFGARPEQEPEWREVQRLGDVIKKLAPLVSAVPERLLSEAISRGTRCDDPVARSICTLLLAGFGHAHTG
jgi:hypothetical protein